jgi:hypothetical protein
VLDLLDLVLDLVGGGASDAAVRLVGRARRWFWTCASQSWPTAQTTVLSGRIKKSGNYYIVSAPYWFYAAGDRYGGRYEGEFTTESRAQDTLQRLLASPPLVRYRPTRPDTSVLVED